MTKMIRTKTKATGGITAEEKAKMDEIAAFWTANAFRTDPVDPDRLTSAIKRLYAVAGLKEPRVVIVPSPLVMAFAYGASAAIWHGRSSASAATADATDAATAAATDAAIDAATDAATRGATRVATDAAIDAATYAATDAATYAATAAATRAATRVATDAAIDAAIDAATDAATYAATAAATRAATRVATDAAIDAAIDAATDAAHGAMSACFEIAGSLGIECAKRWMVSYQGGNMWSYVASYFAAMRDVIGLDLPEFAKWKAYEDCAIEGGFRVMHEEFCIVCDRPEVLLVDDQNRPHCENGPSHRWRDGWSLYHWHGVRVPDHWIENKDRLSAAEVLREKNVETRMAGCQIIGWAKVADQLDRRVIDGDPATDIGALVELTLPGLPNPGRFLMAQCPRNGTICEGVPYVSDIDGLPINTAIAAQAWRDCLPASEYVHPTIRT
jgi:hypothetical protein